MLDWVVGRARALVDHRIRRDSRAWRMLARIWAGWLAWEALYRRNPLLRRSWRRSEARFEELLRRHAAQTPDFFVVQIGACDGLMSDPIHELIRRHEWRGILVEPQSREFERLQDTYRDQMDRLVLENIAIADRNGTCTLYRVKDDVRRADWERMIASVLPQDPERFTAEVVPCLTFDALLDRHRVKRIDLLQIDVEGYDFEILKLVDFRRVRPALLRYEHRHLGHADRHACKKFLRSRGYQVMEMEFDTGAAIVPAIGGPA